LVAIVGGAVSGAEAAYQLARQGIEVVVFDQNVLPYGKIEDGLPKWHAKLRDKEESKIDERLGHPRVSFVPGARLGRDIDLDELARQWGFSAVLLAIGAWRDRPLPLPGIDQYRGRGLVYQNALIYWYNHKHEPGYDGPYFDTPDRAIIVGGGLASLDVAKLLMFENVERALRARGHDVNLFTLDRSIAKVLQQLSYTLEDLGLKGCTLYYRRRIQDMPLSPKPATSPDEVARVHQIQKKIFRNYQSKYLFRVQACHMPVDYLVEDNRLAGLIFQRTEIKKSRVHPIPKTEYEVRAPLIVSSIGSIPEPVRGIPMQGQVYKIRGKDCCRVEGFDNVFALGNAVTGRGNIRDSHQHGREVAQVMAQRYLHEPAKYEDVFRQTEQTVNDHLPRITRHLQRFQPPDDKQRQYIAGQVRRLQQKAGYDGHYQHWITAHRPVRLEEMLGEK